MRVRLYLMLLLVLCSALAVEQGLAWRAQQAALRAGIAAARAQWVHAQVATRGLRQRLKGAAASPAPRVDVSLARATVRLRELALADLIRLGAVTVGNFRGRNGAAPVASVRQTTMSGLSFVPVRCEGTYTDIEGLLRFIAALASHGTALSHAAFTGDKFVLDLEVYGT